MSYVLGIDIGTSFTAAAITRLGNDDSPAPQTLNLGLHTSAVPSVIFMADDGRVVVGEAAERRGFNFPDRVVREFKRRIGDTVPIVAGDLCVNAEDIFAVMARWVADRAEEREGEPPEAVTISHPAGWGEYKTGLIRHALAGVGLADVTLLSEPEAAALHYGSQERVEPGSTIAVYDLGGGTFDAALLRKTSEQAFEPLGRPAGIDRLGGADFDEAVFRHVAASMGDTFGQLDVADPAVLLALSRVRRECREAKEALSSDSEATIPVLLPETHSQIRLVRSEFEAMIDAPVRQTVETLAGALESAGLDPDDLSVILLIGGSSRIPLVAQLLSDQLDRPIAVDADPKSSICLGAAYAAAAQIKAAVAEAARGAGAGAAETDGEGTGAGDDVAASAHHESEAHAAPFPAPAVGRHENKQSHNGARIAAIAAGALILTGLTAAAAQGPSGIFGPLTSLSAEQPDSGDAQGSHQKGKQEHDGGAAAAGNGDGAAYEDAEAVSGANSRADAATTARAEEATADGGGGGDGGADGAGGGTPGSPAGRDSGATTADASGDSSTTSSSPAKDRSNTGTTASPSNTGSPSPGNGASGPAPGTPAPAQPGTQNPAPGSGDPAPNPGTPGTAAPDPGPGTGTPTPDPGTAPGTPVPEPSTGAGPVVPAPGTSAPPPPPPPAPAETLVPGPASSTQPVVPASGAPSSSPAPTP
ncbi:Hsp70 family protein [Arthrobacter pigmenti]